MQEKPSYVNCLEEIASFFEERIEFCRSQGIDRARLILDPGIGFGKRLSDNLEILSGLSRFRAFGVPLMVGVSRKSFIGMLNPVGGAPDKRLGGGLAAAVIAVNNGADIVRVHDVAPTVEALKVLQAITNVE
jgi:dihydropteroate synthase